MKKLLLPLLCPVLALPAIAAEPTIFNGDNEIRILPSQLAVDGREYIFITGSDKSNSYESITVYDSNLSNVAEIKLQEPTSVELKQWSQQRKYVCKDATLIQTDAGLVLEIDGKDTGITLNQALNYIKENYSSFAKTFTLDGETIIVSNFYHTDYFGEKYPADYWKLVNGRWTNYMCQYELGDYGPYGPWAEIEEYTTTTKYPNVTRAYLKAGGMEYNSLSITQNLFNNDSKFEYIVPKCKVVDYERPEINGQRGGGQQIVATGYTVLSQDGNTLMQIDCPAGYYGCIYSSGCDFDIVILDNKKYVALDATKDNEHYYLMYRLDDFGGVKAPSIFKTGMKVSPTLPRHGESVNVELGAEALPGCHISVVDIDGREARRINVAPGNSSTAISTSGLAAGTYVVTVNNGTNSREAAKIIVR